MGIHCLVRSYETTRRSLTRHPRAWATRTTCYSSVLTPLATSA